MRYIILFFTLMISNVMAAGNQFPNPFAGIGNTPGSIVVLGTNGIPRLLTPGTVGQILYSNGPNQLPYFNAAPLPNNELAVEQFYQSGDGSDWLPAFQRAFAALNANGGTVSFDGQPYIGSGNLIIPINVRVRGRTCPTGGNRPGNNYNNINSTIVVNPNYSVYVGQTATLECAVIENSFLRSNVPASTRDQINLINNLSGTGITLNGDDATIRRLFILGFNTCVYSTGHARPAIYEIQGDCNNGLIIDNAHDIAKVENVEFYPYLTTNTAWNAPIYNVAAAGANGSGHWRLQIPSGTGIQTGDTIWIGGATSATGVNGRWLATYIDATHIDLQDGGTNPGFTGNTVNGSYQINGVNAGGTISLRLGMNVSGSGIPAGTVITYLWSNRVYISQPATATATNITFSTSSTPYSTNDARLYIHTNRRAGNAFTVTNSETARFVNVFEYGYDTCFSISTGALWTHLVNISCDNYSIGDPNTFGVKIDSSATGTHWNGGSISSYAFPLYVNTSPTYNGNKTAHTVTDVDLNPGFYAVNPIVDFEQGRLILQGISSNSYAGSSILAGSGNEIETFLITGSDLSNTIYRQWDATARTNTKVDTATTISSFQ